MIDYGSVVKKNGQLLQKDLFTEIKEAVGFIIDNKLEYRYNQNVKEYETVKPNGGFFSYMGDKDLLVCVYKTQIVIISNSEKVEKILWFGTDSGYEGPGRRIRFANNFVVNGVCFRIKRMYGQDRFKLRFWYKGDLYECLYGYGVDVNQNAWYDVSAKERRYINKWFAGKA